jgi:non-specific serine/threonine protein kinase/serine/threonine-protein kinase
MTPERWQQLKSVLEPAMELAPERRADFLDESCYGDAELRLEVESFLEYETAADDLLENPIFSPVLQEIAEEMHEEFAGRQIGKYRLLREIGAGGMGMVFLAERADGEFEHQVAVKLLRRSFFDSPAKQRFQQERQILASLHHPFIANLIDGGTTEENTPYLVMEYVEGLPITRFAEEKNLSLNERLDLFRKICEAVSFAHRNLIVHRDLKPDNILICADGTPKLLDFGIAKLMSATEIKATVTRHQPLTPEYAAPEQITGALITTATDIYALGVILYELIAHQRPFSGIDKSGSQNLLRSITEKEPLRPSKIWNSGFRIQDSTSRKRNSKSAVLNPKLLKGDLDNIVLKALKKEPERRYQSVDFFAEDIRRHLAGLPVAARPDTFFYRAEKFVSRNSIAAAALAVAFSSMLAGLFVSTYQTKVARAEREKAERRFNDVRQLANSFVFEINEKIDESPIKAREMLINHAIKYLDRLAAETENDVSLQSELAAAYEKIGDVQSEIFKPGLGNSQAALESHQKALLMRKAIFRRDETDNEAALALGKSYVQVGNAFSMNGNTAKALENYRQAVALNEKLLLQDAENTEFLRSLSRARAMLGQAVLRSGSLTEASQNYERAIAGIKKALEKNPHDLKLARSLSIYYSYNGYAKMEAGERAAAFDLFRKALLIEENIVANDPNNAQYQANLAIAQLWFGVALRETNQIEQAVFYIERALATQQRIFDADRANYGEQNSLADYHLEYGITLARDRKSAAAISTFEKAIVNYEAVARTDKQNTAARRQIIFSRRQMANALAAKGETEKALEIYEQSIPELNAIIASDPENTEYRHDTAICYLRAGEIYLRKNEQRRAVSNFESALPILQRLVDVSPDYEARRSDLAAVQNHLESLKTGYLAKIHGKR